MSRCEPSLPDLLIRAPWWISLILSPLAFILVGGVIPAVLGSILPGANWHQALALPALVAGGIFVLLSGFSAFHRFHRRRLVDQQTSLESLRSVSWKQFEFLVAEVYQREGYEVSYGFKGGADGGVDLDLRRDGQRILVQCKRWKKNVGAPIIRELYGIMQSEHAAGGILVNTAGFTREASTFAQGKPIELVDGTTLLTKVRRVQSAPVSFTAAEVPATPVSVVGMEAHAPLAQPSPGSAPPCPKCGDEMIQRTARRGPNIGNTFWGCRTFPKCRGTR